MLRCCMRAAPVSAAMTTAAMATALFPPAATLVLFEQRRGFNSNIRMTQELGAAARLKNITPIVGQPKPAEREGEWVCPFPLQTRMTDAIRQILEAHNWSAPEIQREIDNFESSKGGSVKSNGRDNRQSWHTVEDYQRTPWYRRWRPNESGTVPMVSHDCMKLLEQHLVPPASRGDPYAHLRKRHYEDTFHTERFSEGYTRHMTRESLAPYTKGMPQYGARSRKEFLAFEKEYRRRQSGSMSQLGESYNAWRASHRTGSTSESK